MSQMTKTLSRGWFGGWFGGWFHCATLLHTDDVVSLLKFGHDSFPSSFSPSKMSSDLDGVSSKKKHEKHESEHL